MLKALLSLISLTLVFTLFGQNSDGIQKCGQFEALEKMKIEDPIRYQVYQQSRINLEQDSGNSMPKSGTIYTIPVVFHVLHNNGPENVSDQQIQDALYILNRDFRKLNNDVNSVYASFLPIASDVEIEFAFATIAPNGYCFDGITRTVSSQTSNGGNGMAQVNAIVNGNDIYQGIWPHHKYLNIYVCEDLGTAAGYTYLPNGYASVDISDMRYNSVFMRFDYIGSIGTSSVNKSRVLTHEVGHWLNLNHIWGGGYVEQSCGDDDVADTPITQGFTVCHSNPNNARVCDPNIVENFENYMDYSFCAKMFTQGQTARMRTAITSNIGGRDNTWTTLNLQEVGVLGSPHPLCKAKIEATETLICEGSSVTFSLTGVIQPITSYSWSFPGGLPTVSTQANPTVTYNTPGIYGVSLTITTASDSKVINNLSYIHVDENRTVQPLPISEGFVGTVFPPQDWLINNGGEPTTWERSTKGTAPTAGSSATLSFDAGSTLGDIDDLITPAFSLSSHASASLTFDVAYRRYDDVFYDRLEVLVSPGCGMPYELVYFKENTLLATEPEGYGYDQPNVWRNEAIDLTPFTGNSNVNIKFRGISGWGNLIYIDNVNIDAVIKYFTASESVICKDESVTFVSIATGASSWDWNFGPGASPATATGAGPHTVNYSSSGTKNISLSLDGGQTSTTQTIMVNASPNISLLNFSSHCVYHSPITLTQGSPSGGVYSGVGVTGNQFAPSIAGLGSHTITYTYTSPSTNCSSSRSKQITVDGCLGLDEENTSSFKLFPNPTTGVITISSSSLIKEVTVLDNIGRVVVRLNPAYSSEVEMNLDHLSSGIYVVLTNVGSETNMSKVVIE